MHHDFLNQVMSCNYAVPVKLKISSLPTKDTLPPCLLISPPFLLLSFLPPFFLPQLLLRSFYVSDIVLCANM